jgi:hypothetical protein
MLLVRLRASAFSRAPRHVCGLKIRQEKIGSLSKHIRELDDVQKPSPPGDWISDESNLLAPDAKARMNEQFDHLSLTTGAQMAVVLVEDIRPGGHAVTSIQQYGKFTEALFDHWGVGREGVNDGVMLALFREGRRIEVRTGRGVMHMLPDKWLTDMQQNKLVPLFRRNKHAEGVEVAVDLIVRRLLGPPGSAPASISSGRAAAAIDDGVGSSDRAAATIEGGGGSAETDPSRPALMRFGGGGVVARPAVQNGGGGSGGGGDDLSLVRLFAVFAFIAIASAGQEYSAQRKRRQCRKCGSQCRLVPSWLDREARSEDGVRRLERPQGGGGGQGEDMWVGEGPQAAALSSCALLERRLGACTFELLHCPQCHHEHVGRRVRWGRNYSSCGKCGCGTERRTTHTEVEPTTYSEGRRRVDVWCANCGERRVWYERIPKETSSSSGSGGGGGFGGGSSSGGGGGGASWFAADESSDTLPAPSDLLDVIVSSKYGTEWLAQVRAGQQR